MIKLPLFQREKAAALFYRKRMHLSINHISEIMSRSTRTIWKTLKKNLSSASKKYHLWFDLRKTPKLMRIRGESVFRARRAMLEWCLYAFLTGLRDDIEVLLGEEPPPTP